MRVLLVGLRQPGQAGRHCEEGLRQLEPRVQLEALDAAAHPVLRYRDSPNPLISQTAGALHKGWLNRAVRARARAVKPDAVIVIKGQELRPATLEAVRAETGAALVNWNTDNPFNPLNTSRDLLACIPLYDCCFIWGRFLLEQLRQAGARRAEYLPFAYNPALHRPVPDAPRHGARVVFAGSPDAARLPLLRRVADLDLGLWGNHWDRLPPGDALRACWRGVAEGAGLAPVLSAGEIALNFVRAQNGPAHNMRTFEAPACGAFLLASRTEEQVEFLGEGEAAGAAFFESAEELREKAEYYLAHSGERQAIALRGCERITGGRHTYRDRMERVLDTIEGKDQPGA
jgi:spore maturation protein CgeB